MKTPRWCVKNALALHWLRTGQILRRPLALQLYLWFSAISGPVYQVVLRQRLAQGKEDPKRVSERYGLSTIARPEGPLIWFHAASVGESQAILDPVRQLLEKRPELTVLVTTTTRSSATLLSDQLPNRAIHQYSPVDTPSATRAFLHHWQPDCAIWTESELWPRLLKETKALDVPMFLVNARVSPKTAKRWQRFSGPVGELLSYFRGILAQDGKTASLIGDLGYPAGKLSVTGSTKQTATALPYDPNILKNLKESTAGRPIWLAASTHKGEEEHVVAAHQQLMSLQGNALLLLAPRHPERGDEIERQLNDAGFVCSRRSRTDAITPQTTVYLADTLGELGLWYRLAPVAFIGGSLVPVGGHNPYEPLAVGCATITGPHTYNFQDIYERLAQTQGTTIARDATDIASAVWDLWDHDTRGRQIRLGQKEIGQVGNATERLLEICAPYIR